MIDWSWCDGYLLWSSYIPTYWTSNYSHSNHDQRLVLQYIPTHNTENCSFWRFGAQYVSLVLCIYRRIYWAAKATYTLWLLGKPLVLIFYWYLYVRYLWASHWNKRLMIMTIMTRNDSHINHDECLVLTIYSLCILTHTEHQTTTSIFYWFSIVNHRSLFMKLVNFMTGLVTDWLIMVWWISLVMILHSYLLNIKWPTCQTPRTLCLHYIFTICSNSHWAQNVYRHSYFIYFLFSTTNHCFLSG